MSMFLGICVVSLLIWGHLFLFRGQFWQADQRLSSANDDLENWPSVCAVIPARNEEQTIARTVRSLLDQDYPGDFQIIVVNDNSDDDTRTEAEGAAQSSDEPSRVRVVDGLPLADGWVGKMWAVSQGIEASGEPDYLLFTDADIEHGRSSVRNLVTKAESAGLSLVSEMVKLNCNSFWERLLIPAFVYFFQKLYPFPQVNDPDQAIAGAAGGSMLVRRSDLVAAGGIERIKDKVIDDCSMAAMLKPVRPIWLGLSETTKSIRSYDNLASIWSMVARTAFVQLRFNPVLLFGTVIAMLIIYVVPVAATIAGYLNNDNALLLVGVVAWLVMWWTFLPTLELYGCSAMWALFLPIVAILYTGMTLDSARRHYIGHGGAWKGRTYSSGHGS